MPSQYAKIHHSRRVTAKQKRNSSHASVRWYNRPSFARKMALLVENAPHPHSQKSQAQTRRGQQGEAKQSSGMDVLSFISDLRSSSRLRGIFMDVYSLVKRSWWGTDTEERENWHALLNGATEHMGWAGTWLGGKGLLQGAAKNYFETHELVGYDSMAHAMKELFELAASPITRAFVVHWLETHGAVRKIRVEAPAPLVMGANRNPKATVADLQAFANDWAVIGWNIGELCSFVEGEWANEVARMMDGFVERKPSHPATLQGYLDKLEEEGLLNQPKGFDSKLLLKIAAEKRGSHFAGELRDAQSQITRNLVWRVFSELGYIQKTDGQGQEVGNFGAVSLEMVGIAERFLRIRERNVDSAIDMEDMDTSYSELKAAAEGIKRGKPAGDREVRYMQGVIRYMEI